MANEFNINAALKFIKEGREPITAKEAGKLVGRKVVSVDEIYGGDVVMYEGTLEKIGPTFHPQVLDYLHFKGMETWHTKKFFGWKRRNYVTNGGKINLSENPIGSVINVEVLFSDGVYYPVHVGLVLEHHDSDFKGCEYCTAYIADHWTKRHKEGTQGFENPGYQEEKALKKVLKKYPKEFEARFGKETFNELAKALLKSGPLNRF